MAQVELNSSFDEIKAEFPELYLQSKQEEYRRQFQKIDENSNGVLDFEEVKKLMENLKNPKTHIELREMIKEVDSTGTGTINFHDFLRMNFPKQVEGQPKKELPLFGKIYQSNLAGLAETHEKAIAANKGKDQKELEAEVKAESAKRKAEREKEKQIKAEQEALRKKEEEKNASKANFASKFSAFNKS